MVAHRDAVYTPLVQLSRDRRVDAPSTRCVFPVGNDDMRLILVFNPWQQPFDSISAYIADDIADKYDLHFFHALFP